MREYVIKGLGTWGGTAASKPEDVSPKVCDATTATLPARDEPREVREPHPDVEPSPPVASTDRRAAHPEPQADKAPAPAEASPEKEAKPPARRGERSFIVSYDGVFVGFFEAEDAVTPREAYLRVAQELCSQSAADFDPGRLELYKPVLLRSARPAKRCKVVRGKFAPVPGRLDEASRHEPHKSEESTGEEEDEESDAEIVALSPVLPVLSRP